MRSGKVAGLAAVLAVAGWCAATAVADAEPPPSPPPAPVPKTVIDRDGTYAVGTDIVPGIYRSAGPVAGTACYWKRVSGDQLIDNALTKKPQVVQIEPTDTAFKTDRCQPWQKTECPPDCPPSPQRPVGGLPGDLRDFLPHLPQPPGPAGAR